MANRKYESYINDIDCHIMGMKFKIIQHVLTMIN